MKLKVGKLYEVIDKLVMWADDETIPVGAVVMIVQTPEEKVNGLFLYGEKTYKYSLGSNIDLNSDIFFKKVRKKTRKSK